MQQKLHNIMNMKSRC